MSLKKEYFGEMPDGREVSLYTITNKNGLEASITDLGAVWVRMVVPDKNGGMDDVMLGFDDAAGYLNNGPHFGSVVGRIAKPHREGKVLPEWKRVYPGGEQWPEQPAQWSGLL